MSSSRRLVLLRHGRTAWNDQGIAQGHADVELDDTGHQQAAAVAPYLRLLEPAALWSSDLLRARQTCEYVAKQTGLAPRYDMRLREFDVGARQGMTMAEFEAAFPAQYGAWRRHDSSLRVPGAEVADEVAARIVPALADALAQLAPGRTAVVVTHGAALRVGLIGLLGWPREATATLRGVDNCGWATLEQLEDEVHGPRVRLVGYNESVRPGHDAPRVL